MDGYRPNSQQWQLSGFGKIQFTPSKRISISLEYSFLRNKIQMPGGLTDSLFDANLKSFHPSKKLAEKSHGIF